MSAPTRLLPVKGVELAAVEAGIRYTGRDDLVLLRLAKGSSVSAVFTQNKCCAAPVSVAKQHLANGNIRALLINSGNANAVTGDRGVENAIQSCETVASVLDIKTEQVLPFSTGVIGEQLNMPALISGVQMAIEHLSEDNWMPGAKAIMTTDTVPKGVSRAFELNGELITITGISKGSGMICPNMATMLAYVVTDADIPQGLADELLSRGVQESFNRITVDSDTSTNDALVLAATKQSKAGQIREKEDIEQFYAALRSVLIDLSTAIIRDGEGATKFVTVKVNLGASQRDCETIAYDIAHSPLVKTALFASDPNWGRILMALGKSAVESLDMQKVDIQINGLSLIEAGQPALSYSEELGQRVFNESEITISIDLHTGAESYHVSSAVRPRRILTCNKLKVKSFISWLRRYFKPNFISTTKALERN